MAAGFYIWPPLYLSENDGSSIDYRNIDSIIAYKDPIKFFHKLDDLGISIMYSQYGSVFLHLDAHESSLEEILSRGKFQQSDDPVCINMENGFRPSFRFCELLACFMLCLNNKMRGIRFFEISTKNLLIRSAPDEQYFYSPFYAESSPEAFYTLNPTGAWRFGIRYSYTTQDELYQACDELKGILRTFRRNVSIDGISILHQFWRMCYCYTTIDLTSCLIFATHIIEILANQAWRNYASSSNYGLAKRKLTGDAKKLVKQWDSHQTGGQAWRPNVSGLIAASLQTGQIDRDIYDHAENARLARNLWIHGSYNASLESAEHALDAAQGFVRSILGIKLKTPSGFSNSNLQI